VGPTRGYGSDPRELQNHSLVERVWKARPQKVRALYAKASDLSAVFPSRAGSGKAGLNLRGPPRKAKYNWRPIVHEYREGRVKRTPGGE
jgi:hypothetical protein